MTKNSIFWTEEAVIDSQSILNTVRLEETFESYTELKNLLLHAEHLISRFPKLFPKSSSYGKLHTIKLRTDLRLVYLLEKEATVIVSLIMKNSKE
jgi:hypothetical protein